MNMKNRTLLLAFMLLFMVASCSRKKDSDTIITKIQAPKVSKEIKTVGNGKDSRSFQWGNATCDAVVTVTADKSLPVVKDDDGNRYYDNGIEVVVKDAGHEVFRHVFHKKDFSSYVDAGYLKPSKSALTSIVFSGVEGGNAVFVATVGSPDTMADEYMLVGINVSKDGGMSMSQIHETE